MRRMKRQLAIPLLALVGLVALATADEAPVPTLPGGGTTAPDGSPDDLEPGDAEPDEPPPPDLVGGEGESEPETPLEPEEPPTGTPVHPPAACAWQKVWRYERSQERESKKNAMSYADSLAFALGAYIDGLSVSVSLSAWAPINSSAAASSDATLHVYRVDETDCQSRIGFRMKVRFRARGEVKAPATAGCAGYQKVIAAGARVEATTAGAIEMSSTPLALPISVLIGPIRVSPVTGTTQTIEQEFIDVDQGIVSASEETFLFAGACAVHTSATSSLLDGSGSGTSAIEKGLVKLDVDCICLSPCTGSIQEAFQQGS